MKALILAGGIGKRLRPLTLTKPKVMVEVNGKPLLTYILNGVKNFVNEAIIVVGYKKESIINYYGNNFNGLKISYVEQIGYKGTAHAPLFAENLLNNKFLMVYGDLFFNQNIYSKIINKNSDGVIVVKRVPNPSDYGVIELDEQGFVKNLLEKVPNPPSNLINAGIYLLPPQIINACKQVPLSKRGEYELTDAIKLLINKGFKFSTVIIDKWIDVGTPDRLLKAELMSIP